MQPTSRRRAVMLGAIFVLATDAFLLASGIHSAPVERERAVEALDLSIASRSRVIRRLQSDWNGEREKVFAGFEALNDTLDLARSPTGIDQAQATWPDVQKLMDGARRANSRLSGLTGRIILEGTLMRSEIDELRGIENPNRLRSLAALDRAVTLTVETQRVYSKINDRIASAVPLYEELFQVTDNFLREERNGRYFSKAVASDNYALRTERFTAPLEQIRRDIGALVSEAEQAASRAVEAFQEYERLSRAR